MVQIGQQVNSLSNKLVSQLMDIVAEHEGRHQDQKHYIQAEKQSIDLVVAHQTFIGDCAPVRLEVDLCLFVDFLAVV